MYSKEYPEIFYPNLSPPNTHLVSHKNPKAGFTESIFEAKLKKYFKNCIIKDKVIGDDRKRPYSPDFIIFIKDSNLIIDVELDEPYAFRSNKPIHINDENRNQYFLEKGWGIIRFAEIQTVKFPELCCKIISEYIRNITGDNIWVEGFHELENLDFFRAWSVEEAQEMALNSYRNTYFKFLRKLIKEKTMINIIADGIYLNKQVQEAKNALSEVPEIANYNKSAKISIFTKLLSKYFHHFKVHKNNEKKIYLEFTIYISKHHSFYNFSFDTDFIELEMYIINIYFIRTDQIICFEITEKIIDENLNKVFVIADDPAYYGLIKDMRVDEIILVRNYHNTFMPNYFKYINIDNLVENSLEIKYKQ